MTDRKRPDRLKPIVAVGTNLKKVPPHLLLTRLYRFTHGGETHVLTNDRATVQFIRRLQAAAYSFDGNEENIPTIEVEILSIQKLTKLNVVEIFKAGLESIVLDTERRKVEPFTQLARYKRYRIGFERKPRAPKKRKQK
ncbi:hypothetical protein NKI96_10685 [Mesorhizobium sp. M0292]|uniref:hypothetical protein n=1 Tax=Mesorhizobium sp. M0292 TaxID=2956929 RepID=UPI0033359BF3